MLADDTTYPLTGARTEVRYDAWAVYKDYDGNAPDGPKMLPCASEKLAEQVAAWLREHDDQDGDDSDIPEALEDFPWPLADGWEHAAHWRTVAVREPAEAIATSWTDLLVRLSAPTC